LLQNVFFLMVVVFFSLFVGLVCVCDWLFFLGTCRCRPAWRVFFCGLLSWRVVFGRLSGCDVLFWSSTVFLYEGFAAQILIPALSVLPLVVVRRASVSEAPRITLSIYEPRRPFPLAARHGSVIFFTPFRPEHIFPSLSAQPSRSIFFLVPACVLIFSGFLSAPQDSQSAQY